MGMSADFAVHTNNEKGEDPGSKGEGLRFAAATMGVPLADTVAIGDSDNDLTMIEVAGIGIAMGNGEQCAKDAADWVADAVDASGLAHAFERLGVV